jgi:hypothetical protein
MKYDLHRVRRSLMCGVYAEVYIFFYLTEQVCILKLCIFVDLHLEMWNTHAPQFLLTESNQLRGMG